MTTMPWLPRFRAWPVKMALHLAVVYESTDSLAVVDLSSVYTPMSVAVDFYREQHIVLQPSVWGIAIGAEAYQELTGDGVWEPMHTHAFRLGGAPMTVIYLPDESNWRHQHLGDSYGRHLAVVAGDQPLAAETLIHEIGHLLLSDPPLPDDHQDGTFMAAVIWNFGPSAITPAQRTRMYEAAYRLGSL